MCSGANVREDTPAKIVTDLITPVNPRLVKTEATARKSEITTTNALADQVSIIISHIVVQNFYILSKTILQNNIIGSCSDNTLKMSTILTIFATRPIYPLIRKKYYTSL